MKTFKTAVLVYSIFGFLFLTGCSIQNPSDTSIGNEINTEKVVVQKYQHLNDQYVVKFYDQSNDGMASKERYFLPDSDHEKVNSLLLIKTSGICVDPENKELTWIYLTKEERYATEKMIRKKYDYPDPSQTKGYLWVDFYKNAYFGEKVKHMVSPNGPDNTIYELPPNQISSMWAEGTPGWGFCVLDGLVYGHSMLHMCNSHGWVGVDDYNKFVAYYRPIWPFFPVSWNDLICAMGWGGGW